MPYLNDPYATNQVRRPRARVLLDDGTAMPLPLTVEVLSANNHTADRFTVEFDLYGDVNFDLDFWQQQSTDLLFDVQFGMLEADDTDATAEQQFESVVLGLVDEFDVNISTGVVRCSGRDLSSKLIDTKTQKSYLNQTSSEVVKALVVKYGLNADIDTTTTLVGRYYSTEHAQVTDGEFSHTTTEWDLLIYLARQENYDLYVSGRTLYFKKALDPATVTDDQCWAVSALEMASQGQNVAVWTQDSSVNNLIIHRSLTLAKDIKVTVKSYHSKNARAFSKTAQRKGKPSKGQRSNPVQDYVYYRPNLTEAQAQALANALLADLSKHEVTLTWSEPGSPDLDARALVQLLDSNSDFDGVYFIDTISLHYSRDSGLEMNCRAKNHSPQATTTS